MEGCPEALNVAVYGVNSLISFHQLIVGCDKDSFPSGSGGLAKVGLKITS